MFRINNSAQFFMTTMIYSTFFTSAWVWIYSIAVVLVKLASRVSPIIDWLKRWLDIDEHPFKALGMVAAIVACLGYWIVAIIFFVAG